MFLKKKKKKKKSVLSSHLLPLLSLSPPALGHSTDQALVLFSAFSSSPVSSVSDFRTDLKKKIIHHSTDLRSLKHISAPATCT